MKNIKDEDYNFKSYDGNQQKSKPMTDKERFEAFTKELAIISSKYGIVIQSTGGVSIYNKDETIQVEYSTDYTSGDLTSDVK